MPTYYNESWQNHLRRALRSNPTEAEAFLWKYLKNEKLGLKFRRQHGFGQYIADFYCWKAQLVIEIDGGIHNKPEVKAKDREKEADLAVHGIEVIRFTNEQVLCNIEAVLRVISEKISPFKGTKGS